MPFAFVSDFVRVNALYNYGGIYLDTDVEVFKSLDEFLEEPAFTGFECDFYPVCATMGAEKGNPLIKELLDYYTDKKFDVTNLTTNTQIISNIFEEISKTKVKNIGTIFKNSYSDS